MSISRADAVQRAGVAADMRVQGHTWSEIATAVGVNNAQAAHRLVQSFYAQMPQVDSDSVRSEVWGRLEFLWREAVLAVLAGKPGALRDGTRLMERFSKMAGLDAPARHELEHSVGFFEVLYGRAVGEVPVSMPQLPEVSNA